MYIKRGQTEGQKILKAVSKSYLLVEESDIMMSSAYKSKRKGKQGHGDSLQVNVGDFSWNPCNHHSKQLNKGRSSTTCTLRPSSRSSMSLSLRISILFVISMMAQLAAALNGSTKGGGVGVSGSFALRSNSISNSGLHKPAQSAASVSNIVNGHYQRVDEDDESSSSIDVMADRYILSTLKLSSK